MTIACIDPAHRDLIRRLNEQRKEGVFCDVLLKVSGLVLPTHACVLSASSPYFKGLITEWRATPPHLAGAPQEIDLVMPGREAGVDGLPGGGDGGDDDNRDPEVVIKIIDYIYTGKINVKEDTVDLVVRLAEIFMLDGLSSIIRNHVSNNSSRGVRTDSVERNIAKPADANLTDSNPVDSKPAVVVKPVEGQPVRAKQVVTLSIKRERKALPPGLQAGQMTEPALILEEPHGLRIRKRDSTVGAADGQLSPTADEDEDDDYWTTPDEDWSPPEDADDLLSDELTTDDDDFASSTSSSPSEEDEDDGDTYYLKKDSKKSSLQQRSVSAKDAGKDDNVVVTRTRARLKRKRAANNDPDSQSVPAKIKKKTKKYQFRCRHKQCDFVSGEPKSIRAHKLIHPGISHVCQTCGLFFTRGCKLLDHLLAATHPETKCSLCEFVADDPASFRQHLSKHDPSKPFMCTYCDFKCSSRCHLTEHAIKHSSERPFVCGLCNSGFKWKNCLRKHMLTHSSEKNHMCDQCDFRTAHRSTLRLHLRVHSGEMLPCTYDGCTFQAYCKRNLQKHIFTHSKEKPYVCEVCGKKYAQEQSLKRHCRVHDPSARVFHCELCQFSTTRNDKLRQHTKKAHNHNIGGDSTSAANPSSTVAALAAPADSNSDPPKDVSWDRDAHHHFAQPPPHPPQTASHHHHHQHPHHHHHREHHAKKTPQTYDQQQQQQPPPHNIARTDAELKASGVPMDREAARFHHFPPHHDQSAMSFMATDIGWAYSLPQ